MANNIFAKFFNRVFKRSENEPELELFEETQPKDTIGEALRRAFEEAPDGTTLKLMELHWPHSDTNFLPLLAFKWSNEEETFEHFEHSLRNLDLEGWAGSVLEFLCDKGFKPIVTFDRRNGIFTFEV